LPARIIRQYDPEKKAWRIGRVKQSPREIVETA
jgi:hypothetical protein